jgi:hypothetical protein
MNNLSGDTVTLSQLVRTEEQGLNVNRLLFAKFLVMTGRISEGTGNAAETADSVLTAKTQAASVGRSKIALAAE